MGFVVLKKNLSSFALGRDEEFLLAVSQSPPILIMNDLNKNQAAYDYR
jgi:hypothetical protein